MTARNVELLERVMQHIDDHPEQHNQAEWLTECGTAARFAGWACRLAGEELIRNGPFTYTRGRHGGSTVSVAAADLLGLTDDEADTLFAAYNTRDELRLMVKDLVNGDELRLHAEYADESSPVGGVA